MSELRVAAAAPAPMASPVPGAKLRGAEKMARLPVKVIATTNLPAKPPWLRIRLSASPRVAEIKRLLRRRGLASVCEEAQCPNLSECFSSGTATFMIMGEVCTRRCPFCDVAHGRPTALNPQEPAELAAAIAELRLRYVVITSVDRDDLRDGGAAHFAECIRQTRQLNPGISVEILTPDFRGRLGKALPILAAEAPDVMNHNLETVPRLYLQARPGADYGHSLELLSGFRRARPDVRTKSGLMLGLGETKDEVVAVMRDLRAHQVGMLTLGQYLQPSRHHLPVARFVEPAEFDEYVVIGDGLGFDHVASGPLVRSSYHADRQSHGEPLP